MEDAGFKKPESGKVSADTTDPLNIVMPWNEKMKFDPTIKAAKDKWDINPAKVEAKPGKVDPK